MTYGLGLCQLSLAFIHSVLYEFYLMTTVALLRKQTSRGYSTWRFCTDASTGSCFAIDPRSRRRWFSDRRQMDRAISNWRGLATVILITLSLFVEVLAS